MWGWDGMSVHHFCGALLIVEPSLIFSVRCLPAGFEDRTVAGIDATLARRVEGGEKPFGRFASAGAY